MNFKAGSAQHQGDRESQEDAFCFSDPTDLEFREHGGILAVVCDGMGGFNDGALASQTALKTFLESYMEKLPEEEIGQALIRSLRHSNDSVLGLSRERGGKDIGTTLVAVVVHKDMLYWTSVGDSRAYLVRSGMLARITTDQNYGVELDLRAARGLISPEEARIHPDRSALVSYVGIKELTKIDRNERPFPLLAGDQILLCSDGLYQTLSDEEIVAGIGNNPQRMADKLVANAIGRSAPAQDNVTVVALSSVSEGEVEFISAPIRSTWIGVLSILFVVLVGIALAVLESGPLTEGSTPAGTDGKQKPAAIPTRISTLGDLDPVKFDLRSDRLSNTQSRVGKEVASERRTA